jgi:hypothetical protein
MGGGRLRLRSRFWREKFMLHATIFGSSRSGTGDEPVGRERLRLLAANVRPIVGGCRRINRSGSHHVAHSQSIYCVHPCLESD